MPASPALKSDLALFCQNAVSDRSRVIAIDRAWCAERAGGWPVAEGVWLSGVAELVELSSFVLPNARPTTTRRPRELSAPLFSLLFATKIQAGVCYWRHATIRI